MKKATRLLPHVASEWLESAELRVGMWLALMGLGKIPVVFSSLASYSTDRATDILKPCNLSVH